MPTLFTDIFYIELNAYVSLFGGPIQTDIQWAAFQIHFDLFIFHIDTKNQDQLGLLAIFSAVSGAWMFIA